MGSLKKKRIPNPDSLHVLASSLKIAVSTLKRLFKREILPSENLVRSKGGQWRVPGWRAKLLEFEARLVIWKFWSRKPNAATGRLRQHEFDELAFASFMENLQHFIVTPDDYIRFIEIYSHELLNHDESGLAKAEYALSRFADFLSEPTGKNLACAIVSLTINRLRQKTGDQITRRDLARELEISEATLYRLPLGKGALRNMLSPPAMRECGLNREERAQFLDTARNQGR